MQLTNITYSVLMNKCPRCHQSKMLSYPPYHINQLLTTEENCAHCGLKFEKEPGFFFGAMYVSYAFTSGIFIVAYLLQIYFLELPLFDFLMWIIGILLLLFPLLARWSRILWLNFFISYDPIYKKVIKD
ncbi:MAG: DUF983 domain-containing protein [Bacteroidia bacterium]|jgi:uncharacterized protein (DUF983 family)